MAQVESALHSGHNPGYDGMQAVMSKGAEMRILVADDHDLVREAIAAVLSSDDGVEVDLAATLDEAMRKVRDNGAYDLIMLDYNMPGMNALDGLTKMIKVNDNKPVALLSGTASHEVAAKALDNGAAGFIPKTLSSRSMVTAAKFMVAGEIYAPLDFMQKRAEAPTGPLTPRELQVLTGICAGQSNKEIARELDLQEVTVKLHVKTLCRKLEARNRTHAAMIARDRTLV